MKLYRSLLVIIEMAIFAIGALFIGLILFPVMAIFISESKRRRIFSKIVKYSWKFFIKIIESTKIIELDIDKNLLDIKGKIITASHPSFIDIILLIGNMPDSLCLAKKELLHNPFMKNIVKTLYIINDIDTEAFKKSAIEALNAGYNIIIFPAGTRTQPGENPKFHHGAAQIAIASNTDIIPVKIETDYPFLIKNHNPLDAGTRPIKYKITVQPEIKLSDFNHNVGEIKLRRQLTQKIKEYIN